MVDDTWQAIIYNLKYFQNSCKELIPMLQTFLKRKFTFSWKREGADNLCVIISVYSAGKSLRIYNFLHLMIKT